MSELLSKGSIRCQTAWWIACSDPRPSEWELAMTKPALPFSFSEEWNSWIQRELVLSTFGVPNGNRQPGPFAALTFRIGTQLVRCFPEFRLHRRLALVVLRRGHPPAEATAGITGFWWGSWVLGGESRAMSAWNQPPVSIPACKSVATSSSAMTWLREGRNSLRALGLLSGIDRGWGGQGWLGAGLHLAHSGLPSTSRPISGHLLQGRHLLLRSSVNAESECMPCRSRLAIIWQFF